MNTNPGKKAEVSVDSSSWIQRISSRDPNLGDLFGTFCSASTYGEALEAVNQRLHNGGHGRLNSEELFKLLQVLRPNRFGPMVTLTEAFESRDIDPGPGVSPVRATPAPKPAPNYSASESKTPSFHAQRTEAFSSVTPGPGADR